MSVTKEKLEELYVGQNLTTEQCAEVLGYSSRGGVIGQLHKFGISLRPKCKSTSPMAKVTKAQLENLYVEQGLTTRQCADALGLATNGAITWWLRKFQIVSRPARFQVGNRTPGDRPPEKAGGWKGGKKEVNCSYCDERLFRFPSLIHETNFCGFICKGKWESENLQGTRNPNWNGGTSFEPYPTTWTNRLREMIRERDGRKCRVCGVEENGSRHDVHHCDYDKKNIGAGNLVTLCPECHGKTNGHRDEWIKFFTAGESVATA